MTTKKVQKNEKEGSHYIALLGKNEVSQYAPLREMGNCMEDTNSCQSWQSQCIELFIINEINMEVHWFANR